MDAKRKNVLISLTTALIVGWWLYGQLTSWPTLETEALGRLLVKAIGVSIVVHIVSAIVIVIAIATVAGIIWGKVDKDVTDERDVAIELYVMRLILVIFSIGLVVTFGLMGWQQLGANAALLYIFVAMYLANIAGDLLKLFWYR